MTHQRYSCFFLGSFCESFEQPMFEAWAYFLLQARSVVVWCNAINTVLIDSSLPTSKKEFEKEVTAETNENYII